MDAIIQLAAGVGLQNTVGWFMPLYLSVANILPTLLVLYDYFDKKAEYSGTNPEDFQFIYDFIVVGSGSAGSVVANRLSENFNVLLLERGGDSNPLTSVPGLAAGFLNRPETDYSYKTIPQNSTCLSLNNRQSLWSRGIGIGGSSLINQMVFLRGHPSDYDNWARVTEDDRWSYVNILPYFLKSENYCFSCELDDSTSPTNKIYHGKEGELFLSKSSYVVMKNEFLDAMRWAKIPRVDLNSPFTKGADTTLCNRKNGRRWSTRDAFIEPIRKRSTLKILKYSRVIKINFHNEGTNRVNGIEYERFGKKYIAHVSKEIILSAGAIDTPKILMLSGIGRRQDLESFGIPVRVVSPVGQNLHDHAYVLLGPFLIDRPLSLNPERDLGQESIDSFLLNSTGPWSTTSTHGQGFFPSSKALQEGESHWPDIQLAFWPSAVTYGLAEELTRINNLRPDVLKAFFNPVAGSDAFFFFVNFARPRSRGSLTLRSSNYADDPLIDPRYYTDDIGVDIRVTVEALKTVLHIAENAPSFKNVGSRLSPEPFPPCKDVPFRSDAYWECFTRQYTGTYYHYVGTAAMGHKKSPNAVVDSELKVLGTQGLRVIDASIFPFVTTANTNAPTIMVAERGSQFIKESWSSVSQTKPSQETIFSKIMFPWQFFQNPFQIYNYI